MTYLNTRRRGERAGFALVITVVIVALLTIMAVAFLSSSTSERAISRAAANKAKSDLAAKTAYDVAVTLLIDNLSQFPDSATTWESVNGINAGTVLYFRDKTPETAIAAGVPAQLNVLPLMSGATVQPIVTKVAALTTLDNTNSFDLNHARFSGDTQGWIGAPPAAATRPEFRGQWINLTNSDGSDRPLRILDGGRKLQGERQFDGQNSARHFHSRRLPCANSVAGNFANRVSNAKPAFGLLRPYRTRHIRFSQQVS
jgi:hypothetical protein